MVMPREDRDEQAFTGLEAAIVFIAFVVVASVFAYVVLGAGMFASQKSQETMHAGLEEAGSALCPGYTVIAKLDNDQGRLDFIAFDLETANDLAAIDMRNMTYTLATTETLVTFLPGDPHVTEDWRYRKDAGDILELGEVVAVTLDTDGAGIGRGIRSPSR